MVQIDYKKTEKNITDWIKKIVTSSGLSDIVVAMSGGVDSAVSAALAVRAIGKEHVCVVMMPYGTLNPESVIDAKKVLASLNIPEENSIVIDIQKAVDAIWSGIPHPLEEGRGEGVRKGNIMARVRMTYLFDVAKKTQALVCGTENRTEYYLGYFTRFGDEASDLEPIRSLYKTQIWEMARHLQIPESIITKAPTAGLWENQTDEGELGFTYNDADSILSAHFDEKLSEEEIIQKGMKKEIVESVLIHVAKNEFKHRVPIVYISKN